jgi:hypothetical protein
MKLIFENTGDELPFDVINHEVLELFGDCKFVSNNQYKSVKQCSRDLNNSLSIINDFLISIDSEIRFPESINTLDQHDLNFLHAHWAKYTHDVSFSTKKPNLLDLFVDDELTCTLRDIANRLPPERLLTHLAHCNEYVHDIEVQFGTNKMFCTKDEIWFDTPNMKYKTSNNIANLSVPASFIGRTLENKFRYFDDDLEFSDENNWDQTPQKLNINFGKSRTIPYSKEYIDWCNRLQREPLGNYLNIGNFVNIDENLTTYRTIMYNNTQAGNSFSIRK